MPSGTPNRLTMDEALEVAMSEHRLDASFRKMVRDLAHDLEDRWRVCCGSACDPCVEQVARVVDRVRALTGGCD